MCKDVNQIIKGQLNGDRNIQNVFVFIDFQDIRKNNKYSKLSKITATVNDLAVDEARILPIIKVKSSHDFMIICYESSKNRPGTIV